ncbi:MAG: hypothetical protein COW41_02185 [Deltaproteobacteria bacterium CG17_big_fil_post_rev_8_21_14_2_50_51_6]|nr:MAG: hypothetical protein COW41_02185 [Deltaproteobacteria bacterium CG17_big_fil_post_rev_8_21_14_2_50_51_6]
MASDQLIILNQRETNAHRYPMYSIAQITLSVKEVRIMEKRIGVMAMVLAAVCMSLLTALPAWSGEYPPQKVVYHLNNKDYIMDVLRNVQNHIKAVGEDKLDVYVVSHASGVNMYLKDKTNDEIMSKIKSLQKQGVKFRQCEFTLQQKKLTLKDTVILTEADMVKSGVAEIIKLQQQGYHYIKP